MAEETKDDADESRLNLDLLDAKTSYANYTHVVVNSTDVSLYFGAVDDGVATNRIKCENKIVVNHVSFTKMMEHWFPRYRLLKRLHGDGLKSLNDFDVQVLHDAFSEMRGNSNGQTSEEGRTSKDE